MTTRIKANLEDAIQTWMDAHCEDVDWPSVYVAPNMAARMAEAAYAVLMANAEGQEYAERESGA